MFLFGLIRGRVYNGQSTTPNTICNLLQWQLGSAATGCLWDKLTYVLLNKTNYLNKSHCIRKRIVRRLHFFNFKYQSRLKVFKGIKQLSGRQKRSKYVIKITQELMAKFEIFPIACFTLYIACFFLNVYLCWHGLDAAARH